MKIMMFNFQNQKWWILILVLLIALGLTGCQWLQATPDQTEILDTLSPEELQSLPVEFVSIEGQQIRQWAVEAEASSSYADPEWAPEQATGAPDTTRCGDYQTAWATAGSDSEETLTLKFPVAVHVTAIHIIQSFNPNQVVMVELIGAFDRSFEVYEKDPFQVDQPCPFTLAIPVEKTEVRFNEIRITVDQSELGLGWNQIDAVELVGEPN